MLEIFWYIMSGFSGGFLGAYLGLGGGEIIVPSLTIMLGLDIRTAVPVSMTAIVVNSFTSSAEYLRHGMVDLELVILIGFFAVLGTLTGSTLSPVVPTEYIQFAMAILLVYAALSFLKCHHGSKRLEFSDNRSRYAVIVLPAAFGIGCFSSLVGVGGGVLLVPLLYLLVGSPLSTARGTTTLIIFFASAAAASVYFLYSMIDLRVAAPVLFGILIGGKAGGYLGTSAKPWVVRIMFCVVMLYLAYKLALRSLVEWV